jgi:hypothetical protein
MKSLSNNKGTIVAVILFLAVIFVYRSFFASTDSVTDQSASAESAGNDILALEQSLDNVNFDLALFSTPTYRALVDYSPVLPTLPIGRPHPFDPIAK